MLRLSSTNQQQVAGELESVRLSNGAGGGTSTLASGHTPLSRAASMEPDNLINAELVPLNEPLQPG